MAPVNRPLEAASDAGISALVTCVVTSAWQAARRAITGRLRGRRVSPSDMPVMPVSAPCEWQANSARGRGTVFAVQHGAQHLSGGEASTFKNSR